MLKLHNITYFLVDCTFQTIKTYDKESNVELSNFILKSIYNLSWFYKFPLFIYFSFVYALALIMRLKPLSRYSTSQKLKFYQNIFLRLPFSNSIEKLIRSLGFMKLYDIKIKNG